MTDDEALARALQASLNQESNPPQQRQTRQQEAEGDSSCSLQWTKSKTPVKVSVN